MVTGMVTWSPETRSNKRPAVRKIRIKSRKPQIWMSLGECDLIKRIIPKPPDSEPEQTRMSDLQELANRAPYKDCASGFSCLGSMTVQVFSWPATSVQFRLLPMGIALKIL